MQSCSSVCVTEGYLQLSAYRYCDQIQQPTTTTLICKCHRRRATATTDWYCWTSAYLPALSQWTGCGPELVGEICSNSTRALNVVCVMVSLYAVCCLSQSTTLFCIWQSTFHSQPTTSIMILYATVINTLKNKNI